MDKVLDFIKKNKYAVIGVLAALLVLSIVVIIVAVSGGGEDINSETDSSGESISVAKDIGEGLPAFPKNADYKDISQEGLYSATYYSDVTSEQVADYVSKLETELSVDFSEGQYPLVAVWEENIITIHYNVTEMRLSVTVTAQTNG